MKRLSVTNEVHKLEGDGKRESMKEKSVTDCNTIY